MDIVQRITKLKDGEGQYLWRQSVRDGEPDTLLGFGVIPSEFAPARSRPGNTSAFWATSPITGSPTP